MYHDKNGESPWLVIGFLAGCVIVGGIIGATIKTKLFRTPIEETKEQTTPQQHTIKAQPSDASVSNKTKPLTTGEKVINTLIGAGIGLGIGGAVVATSGAVGAIALGSATTQIALLGMTGAQTFAIGALAYDVFAFIFAPFMGVELEAIEYAQ